MSLDRPIFKPSTKAMENAGRRDQLFANIPQGSSLRVRFLPAVLESGNIIYKSTQHFKMKDVENQSRSYACLEDHGTEETGTTCLLCQLHEFIEDKSNEDESLDKFVKGKSREHIAASTSYHAQVLINHGEEYTGPHILRLTQTMVDLLIDLNREVELTEETHYTDPDGGFDLIVSSVKGQPWAKVMRTKPNGGLDQIFPGWRDKLLYDVMKSMKLRVQTREELLDIARFTLGEKIDWAEFKAFIGQ